MHKRYDDLNFLASRTNLEHHKISDIDEKLSIDEVADLLLMSLRGGESPPERDKWQNRSSGSSAELANQRMTSNDIPLTHNLQELLKRGQNLLTHALGAKTSEHERVWGKDLEMMVFFLSLIVKIREQSITPFDLHKILRNPKLASKFRDFARCNGIDMPHGLDAVQMIRHMNSAMEQQIVCSVGSKQREAIGLANQLFEAIGFHQPRKQEKEKETQRGLW